MLPLTGTGMPTTLHSKRRQKRNVCNRKLINFKRVSMISLVIFRRQQIPSYPTTTQKSDSLKILGCRRVVHPPRTNTNPRFLTSAQTCENPESSGQRCTPRLLCARLLSFVSSIRNRNPRFVETSQDFEEEQRVCNYLNSSDIT